uniref:Uncharacterized protein n=1 Tax=Arundo donax TaxID=35708 RepID=A0A0A9FLX5_ARUDO
MSQSRFDCVIVDWIQFA